VLIEKKNSFQAINCGVKRCGSVYFVSSLFCPATRFLGSLALTRICCTCRITVTAAPLITTVQVARTWVKALLFESIPSNARGNGVLREERRGVA